MRLGGCSGEGSASSTVLAPTSSAQRGSCLKQLASSRDASPASCSDSMASSDTARQCRAGSGPSGALRFTSAFARWRVTSSPAGPPDGAPPAGRHPPQLLSGSFAEASGEASGEGGPAGARVSWHGAQIGRREPKTCCCCRRFGRDSDSDSKGSDTTSNHGWLLQHGCNLQQFTRRVRVPLQWWCPVLRYDSALQDFCSKRLGS